MGTSTGSVGSTRLAGTPSKAQSSSQPLSLNLPELGPLLTTTDRPSASIPVTTRRWVMGRPPYHTERRCDEAYALEYGTGKAGVWTPDGALYRDDLDDRLLGRYHRPRVGGGAGQTTTRMRMQT
jgi:hypothetical protein